MYEIEENIKRIQESISCAAERVGRNPSAIRIVSVSKRHPVEKIQQAHQLGLRIFGENQVQEAERKIETLADLDIEWHLVGHLQTNKVKKAAPLFDLIHSVDSVRLVEALQKEAAKIDRTIPILLQINISEEESKSGVPVDAFESLLASVKEADRLQCRGLMTIPPYFDDPEEARPIFASLRKLGEQYQDDLIEPGNFVELSMGMTHDFNVAIEEGATFVRIGTAIFGERLVRV